MSDSNSAENSSEPLKKGLSPLAWVGIGCGGIAVLGLIAIVAGGMFLGNKDKQVLKITLIEQGNDTAVMFYTELSK